MYPCALASPGRHCTRRELAAVNVMVWDHCHEHGYIRGPLCAQHNLRMGQYDQGLDAVHPGPRLHRVRPPLLGLLRPLVTATSRINRACSTLTIDSGVLFVAASKTQKAQLLPEPGFPPQFTSPVAQQETGLAACAAAGSDRFSSVDTQRY
ncbi:endonuclease domain-containing protein [[Kitasatospora] papulosa]|uniref:endonuclease domain-containing protein n=1 Tax=Streptomyces TaxID=1883 RepID=UPI003723AAB0